MVQPFRLPWQKISVKKPKLDGSAESHDRRLPQSAR
jgi:hypothetical protein